MLQPWSMRDAGDTGHPGAQEQGPTMSIDRRQETFGQASASGWVYQVVAVPIVWGLMALGGEHGCGIFAHWGWRKSPACSVGECIAGVWNSDLGRRNSAPEPVGGREPCARRVRSAPLHRFRLRCHRGMLPRRALRRGSRWNSIRKQARPRLQCRSAGRARRSYTLPTEAKVPIP